MTTFRLILKEILQRKLNFLLSLLAVVIAASLFVSFFTTGEASKFETIRLMRDIGFNLRIIPKKTNMEKFWQTGFSEYTMPERHVYELASHGGISYAHLTAILQKKVNWQGREVFLTGIAPEISPPGKKKTPMIFTIERGNVYIGFELAQSLDLRKGDIIDIFGKTFTVTQSLSESGSEDDIRIYAHLHDVQSLLNMENKINEIKALQCLCLVDKKNINSQEMLREQLAKILPDAKVILIQNIASARENQRIMAEKYFGFIIPFIVVVCMSWIGILAMSNVRERRQEIGIMRALGYGSSKISALFLGKAVLIGLIGAVVGFGVGTGLALKFGPPIFKVTASMIMPQIKLLYWAVIVSPGVCALSVFIPSMIAVAQDPAITLREE
ncbi:MAG: FtsX-like permease family protein [Candidatus Aminicenantes bacterium]|jgi:ABC-type lipoprotein release transport system permease subunit